MTFWLTTPLVRALVKIDRIKRHAPPGRPLWKRAIALRERLCADITEAEWRAYIELVYVDRVREGLHR